MAVAEEERVSTDESKRRKIAEPASGGKSMTKLTAEERAEIIYGMFVDNDGDNFDLPSEGKRMIADQIRAAEDAAWNEAIERAANIAKDHECPRRPDICGMDIAESIRALRRPEKGGAE